jgi:hypothetical protein
MLSVSISFLSLTLVYFLLGMYRPRWVLFGMKDPGRIWVIVVTALALMAGMTLYGEGLKQKQEIVSEKADETPAKTEAKAAPVAKTKLK